MDVRDVKRGDNLRVTFDLGRVTQVIHLHYHTVIRGLKGNHPTSVSIYRDKDEYELVKYAEGTEEGPDQEEGSDQEEAEEGQG